MPRFMQLSKYFVDSYHLVHNKILQHGHHYHYNNRNSKKKKISHCYFILQVWSLLVFPNA